MTDANAGADSTESATAYPWPEPVVDLSFVAEYSIDDLMECCIQTHVALARLGPPVRNFQSLCYRIGADMAALCPYQDAVADYLDATGNNGKPDTAGVPLLFSTGNAPSKAWPYSVISAAIIRYREKYPTCFTGELDALQWAMPTYKAIDGRTTPVPDPTPPARLGSPGAALPTRGRTLVEAARDPAPTSAQAPAPVQAQRLIEVGDELFGGPAVMRVRKPADLFLCYLNSPAGAGRWLTAQQAADEISAASTMFRMRQIKAVPIGLSAMPAEKRALVQLAMIDGKTHYAGTKHEAPLPEPDPAPAAIADAAPTAAPEAGPLVVGPDETIGGYITRRIGYLPTNRTSEGAVFLASLRTYLAAGHHALSAEQLDEWLPGQVVTRLREAGFTIDYETELLTPPPTTTDASSENPPSGD